MTTKDNKQELRSILLQICGILTEMHKDVLSNSTAVRKKLSFYLSEDNIPEIIPVACHQKFQDIFKEESMRLCNEELLLARAIADVMAITEDVACDKISRSTRNLLLNLMNSFFHETALKSKTQLGALSGKALFLLDNP